MSSFWALEAARRSKAGLVPGTSKWIANELNTYNSTVLASAEVFAHSMNEDYEFLNGFLSKVDQGVAMDAINVDIQPEAPLVYDCANLDNESTAQLVSVPQPVNESGEDQIRTDLQLAAAKSYTINKVSNPDGNSSSRREFVNSGVDLPSKLDIPSSKPLTSGPSDGYHETVESDVAETTSISKNKNPGGNVLVPVERLQPSLLAEEETISKETEVATVKTEKRDTPLEINSEIHHVSLVSSPKSSPNKVGSHNVQPNVRPKLLETSTVEPVPSSDHSFSPANFTFIPAPESNLDKDDSFQAIRSAIRKSIAGKSRVSSPTRKSIFAPLPSREPLAVESRRKSSSWKSLFDYKRELKRPSSAFQSKDDLKDIESPEKAADIIPPTRNHPKLNDKPLATENGVRNSFTKLKSALTQKELIPMNFGNIVADQDQVEFAINNEIEDEVVQKDEIVTQNSTVNRNSIRSITNREILITKKPSSRVPLKEIISKSSDSGISTFEKEKGISITKSSSKESRATFNERVKPFELESPTRKTPRRPYESSNGTYSNLRRSRNLFLDNEPYTNSKVSPVKSSNAKIVATSKYRQTSTGTVEASRMRLKQRQIKSQEGNSPMKTKHDRISLLPRQRSIVPDPIRKDSLVTSQIPTLKSPIRRLLAGTGSPVRDNAYRSLINKNVASQRDENQDSIPLSTRKRANTIAQTDSLQNRKSKSPNDNLKKVPTSLGSSPVTDSSPINRKSGSRINQSPARAIESDLIDRLMVPTSSSAAKYRKTVEKKDIGVKNKLLTATLNPTKPPKFSPNKNRYGTLRQQVANRPIQSPIKRTIESLDASTKKSSDSKVAQATDVKEISSKRQKSTTQVKLPLLKKSLHDDSKPKRKTGGTYSSANTNTNTVSNILPTTASMLTTTPSNKKKSTFYSGSHFHTNNDKNFSSKPLENPGRISSTKTPKGDQNPYKTPAKSSKLLISAPGTTTKSILPEIFSDDDVEGGREKRALEEWAETPELKKVLLQQQNINPDSIFGKIPPLNMDDIFESQASRNRGRALPITPGK